MQILIESFIEDAKEYLKKIELAASTNDKSALENAAHALRSSSATFGALALAALAGEIEDYCLDEEIDKAMDLAHGISTNSEGVFSAIKSFVQDRAAD